MSDKINETSSDYLGRSYSSGIADNRGFGNNVKEKGEEMMLFRQIFFIVIALAPIVRVSILPNRAWIPIAVCWGILALSFTYYMSGLTPDEINGMLYSKTLVVCEFIELLLFVLIVFSSGTAGRIIGYFPGCNDTCTDSIALISCFTLFSVP